MAALLICEAIRTMPTSGLAAVSALQQVVLGENVQAIFDIEVHLFDQLIP